MTWIKGKPKKVGFYWARTILDNGFKKDKVVEIGDMSYGIGKPELYVIDQDMSVKDIDYHCPILKPTESQI